MLQVEVDYVFTIKKRNKKYLIDRKAKTLDIQVI
jgi:hypothetical protein